MATGLVPGPVARHQTALLGRFAVERTQHGSAPGPGRGQRRRGVAGILAAGLVHGPVGSIEGALLGREPVDAVQRVAALIVARGTVGASAAEHEVG